MLVVLGILVALLAISVMAFRRLGTNFKNKAAASQLETVFRQARNSALQARAPAFVELEVDKASRTPRVVPWQYRLVGQWHFEEAGRETLGAFGKNGLVKGCPS